MPEWISEIVSFMEPWWPFFAKVGTMWILGQFFKKRVWTKSRAKRNSFFRFMRTTMPLHPLPLGVVWGLLYPFLPASGIVESQGGAIQEGVIAWLFSIGGYMLLEFTAEYYVKRDPDSKWEIVLRFLREAIPERETVPPKDQG